MPLERGESPDEDVQCIPEFGRLEKLLGKRKNFKTQFSDGNIYVCRRQNGTFDLEIVETFNAGEGFVGVHTVTFNVYKDGVTAKRPISLDMIGAILTTLETQLNRQ